MDTPALAGVVSSASGPPPRRFIHSLWFWLVTLAVVVGVAVFVVSGGASGAVGDCGGG